MDIVDLLESRDGGLIAPDQCTAFANDGERLVNDWRGLSKRANDSSSTNKPETQQYQIYLQRCKDLRCRIEDAINLNKAAETTRECNVNGPTIRPPNERLASQSAHGSDPKRSVSKSPKLLSHCGEGESSLAQALAEAQGASMNRIPLKKVRKSPGGSGVRWASVRVQTRPTQPVRPSSTCNTARPPSKSVRISCQPQLRSAHSALGNEHVQDAFKEAMKILKQRMKDKDLRVHKIDTINSHKNVVEGVTTSGTGTTINVGGSSNTGSVITNASVPMRAPHKATEAPGTG